MMNFGRYLREQRLLTPSELEEALKSQVVYGGRLGTNLVELKLMSSEELTRHLGAYTGFPVARADLVQHPERAALKAVPIELARRYSLLALKLDEGAIHLAMLDPQDASQIREVAQATGRKVRPHVVGETELLLALEKHLGICRPLRFVSPTQRPADQELLLTEEAPPDAEAVRAAKAREMEALGMRPLSKNEELLDAESFSSLQVNLALARDAAENGGVVPSVAQRRAPVPAPPVPEAAGAPPSTLAEVAVLEAEIAAALDRDQVAALALRLARAYVPAAALFVVHRDMILGFHAEGLERGVEGIMFPAGADSVFARPAITSEAYRGAPPRGGLDARILRALGRADVNELVVLPVAIRDRVVNVLYADNGDQPLLETAVAALEAVGTCVSKAYERIIHYRKRLTE